MAMAIRRLAGDTIIERAGRQRAPAASALLAATAMGAAVLVPVTGASVPAFAILGLMVANIVTSAFCWPAA